MKTSGDIPQMIIFVASGYHTTIGDMQKLPQLGPGRNRSIVVGWSVVDLRGFVLEKGVGKMCIRYRWIAAALHCD